MLIGAAGLLVARLQMGWHGGKALTKRPMTDEQKTRFAALQGAWLAVREKRRRAEMAAELDAAIMEFLKLHRAETDTVVLQAFQRWVRGAA